MRFFFIVWGKLLGVYLLYLSLGMAFSTLPYVAASFNSQTDPYGKMALISSAGSLIVLLMFSLVLLFKTDWLAGFVGLDADSEYVSKANTENLPKNGIVLIGLYVFAINIGKFIAIIYLQLAEANMGLDPMGTNPSGIGVSKDLITLAITMAFSVFLIFGSGAIVRLVHRDNGL